MSSLLSSMFRQRVSELKNYNMSNEATEDTGYPTGYLNFDYLNSYVNYEFDSGTGLKSPYYCLGITDGSYIAMIGNTSTGKTTLVAQIAANIVRPFASSTIFEDSIETGLTHARRRSLSKFDKDEYHNRYIIRNTGVTAENFYQRIKMIHDMKTKNPSEYLYDTGRKDLYGNPIMKFEPTVYIIDSIAMLMPEKYTEEDEMAGKSIGASSALVVTSVFKTILPMLKAANIILFGINHILEDVNMTAMPKKQIVPGLKQNERIPKGRSVTYLANTVIRIENCGKLKAEEAFHVEGSITEVSLVKSRSSGRKASIRLIFDFNNGFDPWLSLLQFMKDNKLLYGGGVSMSFDESKQFKFSQASFKNQVINDPTFRAAFIQTILPHLKKMSSGKDTLAEDTHVEELLSMPELYAVI